jgi:hypothetical protein
MTFLRLPVICTLFGLGLAGLSGPASAAGTVDVSPQEAERPFTFEDWCRGIKNYPAERCARRQEEDLDAFEEIKDDLAEIMREDEARAPDGFDVDFNACDDDITPVWDEENCAPVTEPGPSIQPVPRGKP